VTAEVAAMPGLDATVMCRNMMAGPTVIASDPKQTHEVIFAGRDDPGGEDVQPIPEALVRSPAFVRAIRQGILAVVAGEDNPVIQAAMARQSGSFRDRMAADELKVREVLDAPSDNDMLVVACIGPGTREGLSCEEQVPVRARDKDSSPPLCDRHQHLADFAVKRGSRPWALEDTG
jgi:hypothetical protein